MILRPACGDALDAAKPHCPRCGAGRVVPLGDGDTAPACSFHPSRRASCPCPRCGGFACPICLVDTPFGALCRDCHRSGERDRREFPLRDSRRRLWSPATRLIWGLLVHPIETLRLAPLSGLENRFLTIETALIATSVLANAAFLAWIDSQSRKPDPVVPIVGGVLGVLGLPFAVFFWISVVPVFDRMALWLVGASVPGFDFQIRASTYALAPMTIGLPLWGCCLGPVWVLVLKVIAYRELLRLSWNNALFGVFAWPAALTALSLALRWDVR